MKSLAGVHAARTAVQVEEHQKQRQETLTVALRSCVGVYQQLASGLAENVAGVAGARHLPCDNRERRACGETFILLQAQQFEFLVSHLPLLVSLHLLPDVLF